MTTAPINRFIIYSNQGARRKGRATHTRGERYHHDVKQRQEQASRQGLTSLALPHHLSGIMGADDSAGAATTVKSGRAA